MAYASCVWLALAFWGTTVFQTRMLVCVTGAAALLTNALSLALLSRWRKRPSVALEGYLFSALGRSGVLLVCALVGLDSLPQYARHDFGLLLLIGYFATAPLHVWTLLLCVRPLCGREASERNAVAVSDDGDANFFHLLADSRAKATGYER